MNIALLREYLAVSDGSPTGLVWIKQPNTRIKIGAPAFTAISDGYYIGLFRGVNYKAHRVVYALVHGIVPGIVDHIDGTTLNNTPSNLRDCSSMENSHNMRGVKGYSKCTRSGKYQARIRSGGRMLSLGYYDTPEEAHEAYLAGKRVHHPSVPGIYYADSR